VSKLGRDTSAELAPALLELGQPIALQVFGDVIEIDARRRQLVKHLAAGGVSTGHGVAGDLPVIGEVLQGGARHRVDGPARDQPGDVHGVRVGRILDSGGGPQRPLRPRAKAGEPLPALGGGQLLVGLVSQPGVGQRGRALERKRLGRGDVIQARIDLRVHPGDEEGGH
jgi:hypothetical protein